MPAWPAAALGAPRDAAAVRRHRRPRARARLFCIPHSGAGASAFTPWAALLPGSLELCAIQLPGREDRLAEPLPATLAELVAGLARALAGYVDLPFVLLGHSSGAIVALELARALADGGAPPRRLIVSACRPPHLPSPGPSLHELTDPELVATLRGLDGIPDEALRSAELMALVLPRIRADVALIARHHGDAGPVAWPLTALGGLADPSVDRRALLAWAAQTTATFRLRMVRGDHFYVTKRAAEVVPLVVDEIDEVLDDHA